MEEEDEVISFLDRVLDDEDVFDSVEWDLESTLMPENCLSLRPFKVSRATMGGTVKYV